MLREPLRLRILRVILRPRRVILRRFLRLEPPVLGPKGFNELSIFSIPLGPLGRAGGIGIGIGTGGMGVGGMGAAEEADILVLSHIIFVRTA